MLTPARGVALLLAFLLEMGALVVVAVALGRGPGGVSAAIGGVLVMGVTWGLFASPQAKWPLEGPVRYAFLAVWFGAAALALAALAGPWWTAAAVLLLVGNTLLLASTGGRPSTEWERTAR